MKSSHIFLVLALLILVSMGLMIGCGSNPTGGGGGGGGGGGTAPWVYFGSESTNSVYYIGPDSETISGTIELGCYTPYHLAASPDGKKLYVSTASSPEILVIDTTGSNANTITGLITLDATSRSYAMRVSSDGKNLYMGVGSNIYKVYTETGTFDSGAAGGTVLAVALSPDDSKIYYANNSPAINVANVSNVGSITKSIGTGGAVCYDMAVKDGKIYAPLYNVASAQCMVINTTNDAESLITGEGNSYFGTVAIPGTSEVYISSRVASGKIYVIDTSVPTFEAVSISDGTSLAYPDYMAYAAAATGKYVCVMDGPPVFHGKIGYVNTATRVVEGYSTIPFVEVSLNANNIAVIYK